MEIIIKGKRNEGKTILAIVLMRLFRHLPYDISYVGINESEIKTVMDRVGNADEGAYELLKEFETKKHKKISIIDTDTKE